MCDIGMMDNPEILRLQDEICYLKALLDDSGISYDYEAYCRERETDEQRPLTSNEYSNQAILHPDVSLSNVTAEMAIQFYSLFRGRKDVYSKRVKKGYFPVCENFWKPGLCPKMDGTKTKCSDCSARSYQPLTKSVLMAHMNGEREDCRDVVGIYPLHPDGTCWFLVFDFDNHDEGDDSVRWQEEIEALRKVCALAMVDALVERSRSGKGAHLWIFFKEAIPAAKARKFGDALVCKGAEYVNLKTFSYFDRMMPMQSSLPEGGLGNLIALPLQGQALKSGNSAFVDENWQPYPDQWQKLMSVKKLSAAQVDEYLLQWCDNTDPMDVFRNEEDTHESQLFTLQQNSMSCEDVKGSVSIVLADGIYIDKRNLCPKIQNAIRRLATYPNSQFYQNLALGLSTRETPRIVYCGYDEDNFIVIPRGCLDELKKLMDGFEYSVVDQRQQGRSLTVSFKGSLYPEQSKATDQILSHETGVLSAATAFGKTVVGAYLIGQRRVNTLILVHNVEIMQNWVNDLGRFLDIREEMPTYYTPTGRVKKRSSLIGTLTSQRNTLTGIIDIVMVSSLGKDDQVNPLVRNYGMLIMDECHHAAAHTDEMVLRSVTAKYVYGLTATPKRDDGQGKKVFMLLGPVRHRYTARERAAKQGINHFVYPRFTSLVDLKPSQDRHITDYYRLVVESEVRNHQIVSDAIECVQKGRTPVVMTKQKEHAAILFEALRSAADHVFLLEGGKSRKDRDEIRRQMAAVGPGESMLVIAIGQYIGEGFNFPRLDTLLLAMPISFATNVEQYAGRLNRDYEGKKDVIIFDYIDWHIQKLERMYHKRLRTYKRIGFEVCPQVEDSQSVLNSIFDSESYATVYETDLRATRREVVISSSYLSSSKVWHFAAMGLMERGIYVTVLTQSSDSYPEDGRQHHSELIQRLRDFGVQVIESPRCYERFAVIDSRIVWYGSMNLLSNPKSDDNLMRVESPEIAQELLEIVASRVL